MPIGRALEPLPDDTMIPIGSALQELERGRKDPTTARQRLVKAQNELEESLSHVTFRPGRFADHAQEMRRTLYGWEEEIRNHPPLGVLELHKDTSVITEILYHYQPKHHYITREALEGKRVVLARGVVSKKNYLYDLKLLYSLGAFQIGVSACALPAILLPELWNGIAPALFYTGCVTMFIGIGAFFHTGTEGAIIKSGPDPLARLGDELVRRGTEMDRIYAEVRR